MRIRDISDDELDALWNAYLNYGRELKEKLACYSKICEINDIVLDDVTQIYRFEMMTYAVYKENLKNSLFHRLKKSQERNKTPRQRRNQNQYQNKYQKQRSPRSGSRSQTTKNTTILKKRTFGEMNDIKEKLISKNGNGNDNGNDKVMMKNDSNAKNADIISQQQNAAEPNNSETESPPRKRLRT